MGAACRIFGTAAGMGNACAALRGRQGAGHLPTMAFVPHVPRQAASPQAQDLANRIGALIREYVRDHPDLTERDVRDALSAAGAPEGVGRRPGVRAAVVGVVAAIVALGVVLQRSSGAPAWTETGLIAMVAVLLAIVALVRRRS